MRTSSAYVAECTYVVDFATVVVVYRSICNTAKAGKEPLRKRVERVAGYFLLDLPLLVAAWKRRKSFTVARSGAFTCFFKDPVPYSSLIGNRQSFLKGILLHFFMMPAEMPRQY